jgi:predicted MPP superfamily phosphohydrolase
MTTMIAFLKAHKRATVIVVSWIVFFVFWLIPNRREGPFYFVLFSAVFVMLIASQLFWMGCLLDLGERLIPGKPRRALVAVLATIAGLFVFASVTSFIPPGDSTHLSLRNVLIDAPFSWWFVGSLAGFGLVILFWAVDRAARSLAWAYRQARRAVAGHAADPTSSAVAPAPPSAARRRLLKQAAVALSAAPFGAAAYGLLYGRLDVEVTRPRIGIARLPRAFEGFRIVQLSDFHISPFMTAEEIRRCVTIANELRADLVVLTGDFVLDDPAAEGEVVQVLSALKAPFGVFGCLGNHEFFTKTEDSITRLFAAAGTSILRQERVGIRAHGEMLNLIGIDYQTVPLSREHEGHVVERYLAGSEDLVMPDMVNILLSHNPNTFDRAAELGIDLTLAGHTHGGQLSLAFLDRELTLASLQTPYPSGWYEKPGGPQLYVSRGIGTTGFPIRFGARPEITLFELERGASATRRS